MRELPVSKDPTHEWVRLDDMSLCYRKIRKECTKESEIGIPMFISDNMQPVQSMLDGMMYESKSALRATYKAAGVVEVGNDPSRFNKPKKQPSNKKDLRQTIEKAKARFERGERVAKF